MLMERTIIDQLKCTGCGVCGAICPQRSITMVDGRAQVNHFDCFLCGHCQAVCPADAVELPGIPRQLGLITTVEKAEAVAPGQTPVQELVALMRSRRSCRKYRERPVPLEVLVDLVKIGTTAPSGTNSQGWNFAILPSREDVLVLGGMVADYFRKLNRLAANPLLRGLTRFTSGDSLGRYYRNYFATVEGALREWDEQGIDRLFHGATAAILVSNRKDASCPAEDAMLATENILLAAHAMGFGSCLIGFAVEAMRRTPSLKEKMAIPAMEEIYSVIALGIPAIHYCRPANRKVVTPRVLRPAGR